MTVRWTSTASRDLEQLHGYIAHVNKAFDNNTAAARTVDSILTGIDTLERHPLAGRLGRVKGTRELIFSPYVVAYRLKRPVIEVLAIFHGSRRWPNAF
jgi:toxin ParE1/3/4